MMLLNFHFFAGDTLPAAGFWHANGTASKKPLLRLAHRFHLLQRSIASGRWPVKSDLGNLLEEGFLQDRNTCLIGGSPGPKSVYVIRKISNIMPKR